MQSSLLISSMPRVDDASLLGFFEDFKNRANGTVDLQGPWKVYSGTATVDNAAGDLSVTAQYSANARGTMLQRKFSEGRIRALIRSTNKQFILGFRHRLSDDSRYGVWYNTGVIEFGWLVGTAVTPKVNTNPPSIVPPAEDFWVEVTVPAIYVGATFEVRVWGVSQVYPVAATYTYTLATGDPLLEEGYVSLQGTSAAAAKFAKLEIMDGDTPRNKVKADANFLGRWFHRIINGKTTMGTIAQGSEIRAIVEGTRSVVANFYAHPSVSGGYPPYIAYSVDGAPFTRASTSPYLIADPTVALTLAQGAAASAFTLNQVVHVRLSWVNANGNTVPTPDTTITVSTAGNQITSTVAIPAGATSALVFVGIAASALQLGSVDTNSGTVAYSGGATAGLSATVGSGNLNLTITGSATGTGAAQPGSNSTWKTGAVSVNIASGLTPRSHTIRIIASGIHEYDLVWERGLGMLFQGFAMDEGATVKPWFSGKKRLLFVGDSITAGILVNGNAGGSQPVNSSAEKAFPHVASNLLGADPLKCGFGGTGATKAGSGFVPKAADNFPYFMNGRPVVELAPDAVVVNQGTNDSGAADAAFQTDYQALIELIRTTYPHRPIFCMRPFNGTHSVQVQAVAQGTADCYYVDTTGWAITFTDGLHPDANGSAVAGQRLADRITQVLGAGFFG